MQKTSLQPANDVPSTHLLVNIYNTYNPINLFVTNITDVAGCLDRALKVVGIR